jgi:hypothetical protein
MDGTYGTYGQDVPTVLWWKNLKDGDYLKERVVDGRIMLEWLLKE